jgi:hypothetical protein
VAQALEVRQTDKGANNAAPQLEPGGLVGGRYLVHGLLGRGGMAAVYDVVDTVRGGRRALKSLMLPPRLERRAAILTLFEREFLTLAQLQHPNVVSAFDYGVDEGVPYYTMELVTGADLQSRVPLPWRTACTVTRDLCGVLALLHSRRLIYRDLNPRNVRSTDDGSTKLIDFGAMCPMGLNRQLVGTPAFCAPEAVQFQPLDGRTDLYALGVLLYLMLTGRIPFNVRDFTQMRAQQLSQPPPPSLLAPDIPSALEELVLDLIRSDAGLRPANAADVIDRLAVIAGLSSNEHLAIPQSYLSTPNLIGRADMLAEVRETMAKGLSRNGASIVLSGASGSGRSRLLVACELEAKLLGVAVLRLDVTDIGSGAYAAARALILQLLEIAADMVLELIWPNVSVLVHVIPELGDRIDGIVPAAIDSGHLDRAVQPLLRQLVIEVSRRQALMIGVDDVDRIDAGSAALLALLAQEVPTNSIVMVSALDGTRAAPMHIRDSLEVLTGSSSAILLEPLAAEATHMLLGSVFGDVPNLQLLAHRLQTISGGNPRDLMQLAQHLVDRGVLRYRNGAWSIPDNLDALDLPSGMAQALRTRVDMLRPDSRALARTMAQSPGQRFAFDECVVLANEEARGRVMESLDELLAAGVLRLEGGLFALAQQGWIATLLNTLSATEAHECNARLARLFAARNDEFRAAQHLLRAQQPQRGLDVLVEHAITSRARTDEDLDAFLALLRSLPDDWLNTYETALLLCTELGRPYAEIYALRGRLCGLIAATSIPATAHFEVLIGDLSRSCGLDLYAAMDPELPATERLKSAFTAAQQRFDRALPTDRGEDPASAVRQLARVVVQVSGIIALGLDYGLALRMPSLEPLAPISPALRVVDKLMLGVAARISGRTQDALEIYAWLLERLGQPDRGGLDPAHHIYTVLGVECGTGMLEAAMGLDSCLARAAHMEAHPQHQVNAVLMRLLHELWQGRPNIAQQLKREAELARIQNTQRRVFEGAHLLGQLTGYAMAGELTGVKETAAAIERQAQLFVGWVPVLHYARAEFHRLCGNAAGALTELEAALSLLQPGSHQIWVWVAAAHVRALSELGDHVHASVLGNEYLTAAQQRKLGYTCNYLRMPLSLALSQLGEHAKAAEHAQACVDDFTALGVTGLNLFLALETRALVAIRSADRQILDDCLRALAQRRAPGSESSLVTCHDRVVKEARKAGLLTREEAQREGDSEAVASSQLVRSTLETCDTIPTMARASLDLLVRSTGSSGGLFYCVTVDGLELQAGVGALAASPELQSFASNFLAAELQQEHSTLSEDQTTATAVSTIRPPVGANLCPLALSHTEAGRYTIVAVAFLLRTRNFRVASPLVTELSRALFSAGVTGVSVRS